MIELKRGIVAVLKNGHILYFPERKEYDAFLKTERTKEIAFLFATPIYMGRAMRRMSDSEQKLDKLTRQIEELGLNTEDWPK